VVVTADVRVRRIYDPVRADDGRRVLVDRLWPRGVSKGDAHLDEWCKEVAPSDELRTWYGHDPDRFEEFRTRYLAELQDPQRAAAKRHLEGLASCGPVTLLTATKDVPRSQAAVLAEAMRG
jgi:uncharacterized protein YeaO (DUF488 family)